MANASEVIRQLNLTAHPVEGGYFRETFRSSESISAEELPRHGASRHAGTAIYFLLEGDGVSEMHKLPGDEIFHYYTGDTLEMLQLKPNGDSEVIVIGPDVLHGQTPQVIIPGGVWQGTRLLPGPNGFALFGATMSPGFDYADYVTGFRDELIARWPDQAERIIRLTPKG